MAFHPYEPEQDDNELDLYAAELSQNEAELAKKRREEAAWRDACYTLANDVRIFLMAQRKPYGHVDYLLLLKVLDEQSYKCWHTGVALVPESLGFDWREDGIHITDSCATMGV